MLFIDAHSVKESLLSKSMVDYSGWWSTQNKQQEIHLNFNLCIFVGSEFRVAGMLVTCSSVWLSFAVTQVPPIIIIVPLVVVAVVALNSVWVLSSSNMYSGTGTGF